jgi:hypothetical protein
MATTKRDQDGENDLIDRIVHHYGLTRDQAREVVRRHRDDPRKIDAAAGDIRAGRRPEHR